jgi:hypothetical protein
MNIENCPDLDINRSPIAQLIAEIAQANNFFLSHYEYRYQLTTPSEWENPIWANKVQWAGGYLPESKYQSFRNDLRIGSFHPGHQSKWSTHELCHSICGFAWNQNFSFLEHSLAARLAELIPVIVFYFLDEVNLNRCSKHLNNIWLKMPYCNDCEKVIATQIITPNYYKEKLIGEAKYFFYKELSAIRESLKTGNLVSNLYGHLDLNSDSIFYVKAHHKRLKSDEFLKFTKYFKSDFHFNSLDQFIVYLEELFLYFINFLETNKKIKLNIKSKEKEFWIAQDFVWRIFDLEKLTPHINLYTQEWFMELSEKPTNETIKRIIEEYKSLEKKNKLIAHDNFFALGYKLDNYLAYSKKSIKEGLLSASPNGLKEIDINADYFTLFMQQLPCRVPLGYRFLNQLKLSGIENHLAELECMIAYSLPFNSNEFIKEQIFDTDVVILNSNIHLIKIESRIVKNFSLKKTDINKFMLIKKIFTGEVDIILIDEEFGLFISKNNSCLFSDIPESFKFDVREHLIYLKA